MKKFLPLALLSLLSLLLGGFLGWQQFSTNNALPAATIQQIKLPDMGKTLHHGEEWLGKVVVVNHWATWCPPCREEIPLFIEAQNNFGALGLQIVGIAHNESIDTVRAYADSIGINYPSLIAIVDGIKIMKQQGNTRGSLPFTAFFDRDGKLVHTRLGQISSEELHTAITSLL